MRGETSVFKIQVILVILTMQRNFLRCWEIFLENKGIPLKVSLFL
ncbi:hypothetical protein EV203_11344 [Caldanaerobacter subterraneus]|jgi:hypothetical protein|uniref:Uncharacterized protein n=1 Tax=Caldanaerobacter subterraneus TaxID=911092 RepID=A0A4R2JX42_9THEO|nr:hypothetical protein EV203_11344 [Caldanaerobacter subterraneus]